MHGFVAAGLARNETEQVIVEQPAAVSFLDERLISQRAFGGEQRGVCKCLLEEEFRLFLTAVNTTAFLIYFPYCDIIYSRKGRVGQSVTLSLLFENGKLREQRVGRNRRLCVDHHGLCFQQMPVFALLFRLGGNGRKVFHDGFRKILSGSIFHRFPHFIVIVRTYSYREKKQKRGQ